MNLDLILQEITDKIRQSLEPDKIIVFGSYALGEPDKDSDVDILVVTGDDFIPRNFAEKMEIKLKVARAVEEIRNRIPIDLIVHTRPMHKKFIELDSMFAREILQHGRVLYESHH